MSEQGDSSLGESLVFEGQVPLRYRVLETDADVAALRARNAESLRIIAAMDEHGLGQAREEGEHLEAGHRLEAKLDILFEILCQYLRAQENLPPAASVRLSATGIEWPSPEAPAEGSRLVLDLYLHPSYPRALHLVAKVDAVHKTQGGSRVHASFEPLEPGLRNWLEKMIFRDHRRRVAQARHAGAD